MPVDAENFTSRESTFQGHPIHTLSVKQIDAARTLLYSDRSKFSLNSEKRVRLPIRSDNSVIIFQA